MASGHPALSTQAVVIGTSIDSLVAAHYLARAGRRVVVLDAHPPSEVERFSSGWVPQTLVKELGLAAHGLKMVEDDPWLAAPLPSGGRIDLWRDPGKSAAEIGKLSARDAARWPEFCERMAALGRLLEDLYLAPPPDPMSKRMVDAMQLAGIALKTRLLRRRGMEDLLRLLPMPVRDLLDDWFESDVLKGLLGAAGVMHLQQGPRSGGTAFVLLHHHVGSPPGVFRPPRSNIQSVLAALPGIELRHGAQVASIAVRAGKACGVVLADGQEIPASPIVSGADPKRTLLGWLDTGWLDPELVRAVRNVRSRGVAACLDLVLERAPGFQVLALAPSLDYLERAYDDAKYGRVSQTPYVEAQSMPDADGRYQVTVHVQYAPYALARGTWDKERCEALGDLTLKMLAEHVPDLASAVVERTVLSPVDLERLEDWPQGQACQAELALDQALWMRPVPELARYRTPVPGLYLCGPAMHPGVPGVCGRNAARQVIKDLRGTVR